MAKAPPPKAAPATDGAASRNSAPRPSAAAPRPLAKPSPKPAAAEPPAEPEPEKRPSRGGRTVAKARARQESDEEKPEHPRGHYAAKQQSKGLMFGWIAALACLVVGGAVVWQIQGKKAAVRKQIEQIEQRDKDFFASLQGLEYTSKEADAERLVILIDEKEAEWKRSVQAAEISSMRVKAKTFLEITREKKAVQDQFDAVRAQLAKIQTLTPAELAEARLRMAELESKRDLFGAEFTAELGAARATADRAYVKSLYEDAKAFTAANPTQGRQALAKYAQAEDETVAALDTAHRLGDKESEDTYKAQLQAILAESDVLSVATFTPEVIDKTPWKDLLSGEQAGYWNPSNTPGFTHRIENGVLQIVGPDAGAGNGIVSIGDREKWRDFVLDMEFSIERGSPMLYFRIYKRADQTVMSTELITGEATLIPGKTYTARAAMIGSQLVVTYEPEDLPPLNDQARWTQSRKGGLGIVVPEGCNLKITRMRVKELRSAGA